MQNKLNVYKKRAITLKIGSLRRNKNLDQQLQYK